jgi:hypothetical protein
LIKKGSDAHRFPFNFLLQLQLFGGNMSNEMNKGQASTTQAELLYQTGLRQERQFRTNVSISWGIFFLILIFLFSGQSIQFGNFSFNTISLDTA